MNENTWKAGIGEKNEPLKMEDLQIPIFLLDIYLKEVS